MKNEKTFDREYPVPSHCTMDYFAYPRLEKDDDGTYRVCYRLNGWRVRKSTGTNVLFKAMRWMALLVARSDISSYHGPLKKGKRSRTAWNNINSIMEKDNRLRAEWKPKFQTVSPFDA